MTEEVKNETEDKIAVSEKDGTESKKQDDGTIPRFRFNEVNDKFKAESARAKELEKKVNDFEEAEKKKKEEKLEKDGEYKELLKAKELEIETHKTEKESLKKNMLLEKVKNKIINVANKEGAVDSEDILKFISIDDLLVLENDKLSEAIDEKISEIKNNKAHLFTTTKRDSRENGSPYSVNTSNGQSNKNMTLNDRIEASLRNSHKR